MLSPNRLGWRVVASRAGMMKLRQTEATLGTAGLGPPFAQSKPAGAGGSVLLCPSRHPPQAITTNQAAIAALFVSSTAMSATTSHQCRACFQIIRLRSCATPTLAATVQICHTR